MPPARGQVSVEHEILPRLRFTSSFAHGQSAPAGGCIRSAECVSCCGRHAEAMAQQRV